MDKRLFEGTLKYLLLGLIMVLLRLLTLGDAFAFGLYVGCLYCLNIYLSGLVFILSAFFGGMECLLCTVVQCIVMTVVSIIHYKAKRKIGRLLLAVYIVVAQVFFVLYQYQSSLLLPRLLSVGVALVFAYISIYVTRAVLGRGLRYTLGTDEQLCLYIVCTVLICALSKVDILPISIVEVFAPFVILLCLSILGKNASFCAGAVMGLGVAVATLDVSVIALYLIYAFVANVFYAISRYFSAVGIVFAQLCMVFFFNIYGSTHFLVILPAIIGCALFCCIPNKVLEGLVDRVGNRKEQYNIAHIVNRMRLSLSNRLYQLSDVFHEIQLTFRSLASSTLAPDKAVLAIAKQVSENVCIDCPDRVKCWRINLARTEQSLLKLVENGIDKGKATLLDIPTPLTSVCLRLNTVLSVANREIVAYKQYYQSASASANSKLLIGEQLEGVSRIMLELSSSCKDRLVFDKDKERRIMQELTFCKCLVKEVAVWNEGETVLCAVTVLSADAGKDVIPAITSRIIGHAMQIDSTEQAQNPSWRILFMRPVPRYNVVFGYSAVTKQSSAMSGDTHSFLRLGEDKFLLALCDGMGSGEQARKVSTTAISLVENFYKAGFDSDIILSAVNRVLAVNSDEAFTAVDICVIDLTIGNADFIKLGAPTSLIRRGQQVTLLQSGSLPMGVLEQTKPIVAKKALEVGDLVILYSDGFADCFDSVEDIASLFASAPSVNPQIIAEEMLSGALAMCDNKPKDDITVICARMSLSQDANK